MGSEFIAGIFLTALGILFSFNNEEIGKGAFKFYRAIYTKKNLPIMFRIAGIFLIVAGLILIFVK